jgi:exosortase
VQQAFRRDSLLLGTLLLVCYFPMFRATASLLSSSDDMAHGLMAPVLAAYVIWEKRQFLASILSGPVAWGLCLVVAGTIGGVISAAGGSTTYARFSFLLSLCGCVLTAGGWNLLKALRFPLSLLLFTFPIPLAFYSELTLPLQLLASRLSESALEFAGYHVLREGNVLHMARRTLSVAEACNGLKSLVTLFFFTLVYAYFLEARLRVRVVLLIAVPPAAIALNAARITLTAMLSDQYPAVLDGVYHDLLGWVCMAIGMALIGIVHFFARNRWISGTGA